MGNLISHLSIKDIIQSFFRSRDEPVLSFPVPICLAPATSWMLPSPAPLQLPPATPRRMNSTPYADTSTTATHALVRRRRDHALEKSLEAAIGGALARGARTAARHGIRHVTGPGRGVSRDAHAVRRVWEAFTSQSHPSFDRFTFQQQVALQ